jgi:hypothetical protein
MSADTRDTIVAATVILAFCGAVIAGMWRIWLKPFLQRELFDPVQEARKQVAENHHSNEKPTVLDRIDDVFQGVASLRSEVRDLDGKLDTHLISSAGIDAGSAAEIAEIKRRLDRLEH